MTAAVEAVGLRKSFGPVTALQDVTMSVAAGRVHGLLGPNGAGKSTLLRVVFGLVRPDEGSVSLFGETHVRDGPARALRGVAGFVDRPRFYPYLTARRQLQLLADADGLNARGSVGEVLDRVGLGAAAGRRVAGWSTGMLQRLAVAAALLRSPRLLVLDEPTEGLDPAAASDLVTLLRSLAADGVTVLLSSHDMDEVDAVCDDVTIMAAGRVARSTTLAELRAGAPATAYRLRTSQDVGAMEAAREHDLEVAVHQRGGLAFEADPAALHRYVLGLGAAGISVQLLEQGVSPLSALFFALTGKPVGANPEPGHGSAHR